MKRALVLGASGGMGYSIVKELSRRGIKVIAFARRKEKLDRLFSQDSNVTTFSGDLFNVNDVIQAAEGADVIFQSANIPYSDWETKLGILFRNMIEATKASQAKLVVVDNIYAYGRSNGRIISEDFPKNPHTKKGRIRLQMENLIKEGNVPFLIARFPDFYGPNAENTLLHYTLQKIVANKKAGYVGNQELAREIIFTPDGAKAIVNLALLDKAYNQNWNIPGYGAITGKEIIETIRKITHYDKTVSTISKKMLQFLGLFNKNMKEMVEMFYLYEEPVLLDGTKYEKWIGKIPRTPYEEGLRQTIGFMKNNQSQT